VTMASHVSKVLKEFGEHVGVSDEDTLSLARKYLALRINMAPTRMAYAYVANDYDLLELRVRDPPLASYASEAASIDVPAVIYMFKHGYHARDRDNHLANRSVAALVAGSAASPAAERWKDVAYLYALNLRKTPQFYRFVEAIFKEDPQNQQRNFGDVYERIKRFVPASREQLAADLGTLIASIQFELPDEVGDEEVVEAALVMEDGSVSRTGSAQLERFVTVANPAATTGLDSLRAQLEPYRKRALLPALAPLTQVAAQMLLAGLGTAQGALPKGVLHRNQKELPALLEGERPLLAAILGSTEFAAPLATKLDFKGDAHIRALAKATNRYEWADVGTLVRHLLEPDKLMDARTLQRFRATATGSDSSHLAACIASCI
jgi:hypothetical protein